MLGASSTSSLLITYTLPHGPEVAGWVAFLGPIKELDFGCSRVLVGLLGVACIVAARVL